MQSSSSLWCCKNIIFSPCKTGLSLDSFIDSFKLGTNYVFFFDRLLLETQQWFIPWPSCLFYASAIHRSVLSDLAPQQTQTVPLKMVRYKKKERKKESKSGSLNQSTKHWDEVWDICTVYKTMLKGIFCLYYVNVLFKGNSRLSTVYLYPATADLPISLRSPCTQINNSILKYVYIVKY